METARIMLPTPEQIEKARLELRAELAKSEGQPEETMQSADEVFAEARARLLQRV